MSKLQTSWSKGIDIDGLTDEEQKRIKKIGLNAWIDELSAKNEKAVFKKSKEAHPSAAEVIAKLTGLPPATGHKAAFLERKMTKAQKMAMAFIAAASGEGIVTYEAAAKINPKYPADPAYYARQSGWEVRTDRKNKLYKVGKYKPK